MKTQTLAVLLAGAVLIVGILLVLFIARPPAPSEEPTATTTDTITNPEGITDYIGLTETEAEMYAAAQGDVFRVVDRDGERLMVTEDFVPGRINAFVVGGTIVSYEVEGDGMVGMNENPPITDQVVDTPPVTRENPHPELMGMTEAEAEAYAEAEGVPFRVGWRDGEPQALTMDLRPGRITATLDDGIVIDYSVEQE
jgi:hypothetical protein